MKATELHLEDSIENSRKLVDSICDLLQLTQEKKKDSLETYNEIMKPVKSVTVPTGFLNHDEHNEDDQENLLFTKSIYLAILKKTASGKNVFKKIEEFLTAKEEKYNNWKEVDKIKFEKKQTLYRFD